jgi:hypothetical protein
MNSNVDGTFQSASEHPPRQKHRFIQIVNFNANINDLASFYVKFF